MENIKEQHAYEQRRIESIIKDRINNKNGQSFDIDKIFEILGWD